MVNYGARWEQEPFSLDSKRLEARQDPYRWVMLILVWLIYLSFGLVWRSVGPLVTPILEDLNISYSQMGIIMGAWPLTYIVVALIGGAIIDRWGIRKSLFVGVIIIGLSEALRYFAGGFATMFLCVALFGIGGPMISIGCPKTISMWFSGKGRGTAVGIYTTGPWIGGLIAYSTINSVVMPLTGYSWRLTFVCLGLIAFVAALLWWFLARDVRTAEPAESTSMTKVFTSLIRIRNVQLIIIMGFLAFAILHGFSNWIPKILETGGLSPAIAGFAASIPILVAIPVILVIPRIVAPHSRGRLIALVSLASAISLLIVASASGSYLITGLVLHGLSAFSIVPMLILILMEVPEVGSRYMGSAAGMFFCVAEIGGFVGPLIIGAIKDLTGSFLIGMCFIASLSFAMSILALLIKTKPTYDT